jgi:hypothetical protein
MIRCSYDLATRVSLPSDRRADVCSGKALDLHSTGARQDDQPNYSECGISWFSSLHRENVGIASRLSYVRCLINPPQFIIFNHPTVHAHITDADRAAKQPIQAI